VSLGEGSGSGNGIAFMEFKTFGYSKMDKGGGLAGVFPFATSEADCYLISECYFITF
jgi:hypothetical protein